MRILWLSHWFPYPPDNGARLRNYNLIKQLSRRHEVTLAAFVEHEPQPQHLTALQQVCSLVHLMPHPTFRPRSLRSLTGFWAPRPRYLVDTYALEMAEAVARQVEAGWPELIVTSEISPATGMSIYAWKSRVGTTKVLRVVEDLELVALRDQFVKADGVKRRLVWGARWWKTVHYVRRLLRDFDGCTVASQQEYDLLKTVTRWPMPLSIIPNGVDLAHYRGDFGTPEPDTLIFSGALTFNFNLEAMAFFLKDVYPLICQRRPGADVTLRITGSTKGVPLETLPQQAGVIFTGYLDDVRPAIARSWVSVVPLLQGGGTRLKILEAMALGTPVVSTSKGAQGLEARPGQDLLIADDPLAFADQVLRLLDDVELRQRLSENGRRLVEKHFDWCAIGRRFEQFLQTILTTERD